MFFWPQGVFIRNKTLIRSAAFAGRMRVDRLADKLIIGRNIPHLMRSMTEKTAMTTTETLGGAENRAVSFCCFET